MHKVDKKVRKYLQISKIFCNFAPYNGQKCANIDPYNGQILIETDPCGGQVLLKIDLYNGQNVRVI